MMKLFLAITIGFGFVFTGIVVAQHGSGFYSGTKQGNFGHRHGMMRGEPSYQHGIGFNIMGPEQMQKEQVEVLAEIKGHSVDSVRKQIETMSVYAFIDQYQVNQNDFELRMYTKMVLLVDKAVKEGKISREQALAIYERMNRMSGHHQSRMDW